MRILVIKSLYVPHESFADKNFETIDIFIKNLLKTNPSYEIIFKIVGWVNDEIPKKDYDRVLKYLSELESKIDVSERTAKFSVEYEIWGTNHGKKYLLRELRSIYPAYRKCNVIIYADHDVSPIDDIISTRAIVGTTVKVQLKNRTENRTVAFVAFRQKPDNRHNLRVFDRSTKIMDMKFYYSHENMDVATGCILTIPKYINIFRDLASENIYGDEDIMIGRAVNYYNMVSVVSERRVDHQYDTNAEYAKWKRETVMSILKNEEVERKDFWDEKDY